VSAESIRERVAILATVRVDVGPFLEQQRHGRPRALGVEKAQYAGGGADKLFEPSFRRKYHEFRGHQHRCGNNDSAGWQGLGAI
jgi:hypothetical protein